MEKQKKLLKDFVPKPDTEHPTLIFRETPGRIDQFHYANEVTVFENLQNEQLKSDKSKRLLDFKWYSRRAVKFDNNCTTEDYDRDTGLPSYILSNDNLDFPLLNRSNGTTLYQESSGLHNSSIPWNYLANFPNSLNNNEDYYRNVFNSDRFFDISDRFDQSGYNIMMTNQTGTTHKFNEIISRESNSLNGQLNSNIPSNNYMNNDVCNHNNMSSCNSHIANDTLATDQQYGIFKNASESGLNPFNINAPDSLNSYACTSVNSSDTDGISSCRSDSSFERNYLKHLPLIEHSYENWKICDRELKSIQTDLNMRGLDLEDVSSSTVNEELGTEESVYGFEHNNSDMKNKSGTSRSSRLPINSVILEFDPLFDASKFQENENSGNGNDLFPITILKPESEIFTTTSSVKHTDGYLVDIELNSVQTDSNTHIPESLWSNIGTQELRTKKYVNSLNKWTSMKNAIKGISDGRNYSIKKQNVSDGSCSNTGILEKPKINNSLTIALHNGYLLKGVSNSDKSKNDFVQRWCQLGEGKLFYSVSKSSSKGFIKLNAVSSIQIIQEHKLSNAGSVVYGFEINTSSRSRPYLFGALCTTERRVWMQKLLENLTSIFPTKYSAEYTRAGWCYLKVGITGDWVPSWILLQRRTLVYCQENANGKEDNNRQLVEIDLRKSRFVGLQDTKENAIISLMKPIILLDTVDQTYYLVIEKLSEASDWHRIIKSAAVDNGINLVEQQLTKDNVPVIVDKCVNFAYAHGSMSEGIYRRSGSNSNVTKLLSLFRQDAWSVQISRKDYTEYDVSSVLKRFFRDLPEPLLMSDLRTHLCNGPGLKCSEEEKVLFYRNILEQLSPVNYVTIRKLMGHLNFIHQQRETNLMPVDNLAAIWGPTLMHTENTDVMQWSKRESQAISDLILLYPKLFLVDDDEQKRENRIREVLEKYHQSSLTQLPLPKKPSGDLKVWIYLHSKDSGQSVHVTVGPSKEAGSLCNELADKMNLPAHVLCLHEHICNGALMRPIHYRERVLDVILRWSYWDEIDRKDNYLVIRESSIIQEILPLAKPPLSISTELKFADLKSKSFKNYLFEFSQSKISFYKDKKGSVKIDEWKMDDILWYIGYEAKRNPHSRWAITFIKKTDMQKRSKEAPYFGWTIAGSSKEEQLRLIAAMLVGQYPHSDLLPSITLLQ